MVAGFVFFSTLSAYNVYWLFSKKILGKISSPSLFFKRESLKIVLLAVYVAGLMYKLF